MATLFALLLPTSVASQPPHLVMMLADDLGWNNIGWRNKELATPALDALRAEAIELERMYTFKYCSPSRSSLLSGRLPLHVTQNNKNNLLTNAGGADLRMTLLPQKLRSAGYRSLAIGKWHVGARSTANLPTSRGFDMHFGFLKGGEDHMTQASNDAGRVCVDLWRDSAPAYGENGTFSTFLYAGEAVRQIEMHASEHADTPLFMYLAWHAVHTPLEAPLRFHVAVPHDTKSGTRSKMNALVQALDEGVANVTSALRRAGMWNNAVVVFQADNGGWIEPNLGGNNWPLRGGKVSDWEVSVRS